MGIKILIVYTVQLQILTIQVLMQYNSKSWPFRSLCSTTPNPEHAESLCSTTPNPDHSGPYAVQLQILTIQVLMQYNSKSWPFRSLCSTTPNPDHSGPYAVQLQIQNMQSPYAVQLQILTIQVLMQYNSKSWPFRSLCSTTPNPDHSDPYAVQLQILTIQVLMQYNSKSRTCRVLMQYNSKSWPFRSLCSTTPNPDHSGPYAVQLQILTIQVLMQYNSKSRTCRVLMQYNSKSWPFRSLCSTTPNPDHSGPYAVQLQIQNMQSPYAVQLQILTIQVLMQYNSKSWPFRSICSTTPNPEHAESLYGTTPNPDHSGPYAVQLQIQNMQSPYAVQLQILTIQVLMQYNSKSWPFRSLCSTTPNPDHSGPYAVQLQIQNMQSPYAVQLQILTIQVLMQYNSKSWPFRSLCSTTPNPDHSGPYAVQLQILTIQILMQYNSKSRTCRVLIWYNSKSWPFRSWSRRTIHYVTAFEYNNIAIILLTWSSLLWWVYCKVTRCVALISWNQKQQLKSLQTYFSNVPATWKSTMRKCVTCLNTAHTMADPLTSCASENIPRTDPTSKVSFECWCKYTLWISQLF